MTKIAGVFWTAFFLILRAESAVHFATLERARSFQARARSVGAQRWRQVPTLEAEQERRIDGATLSLSRARSVITSVPIVGIAVGVYILIAVGSSIVIALIFGGMAVLFLVFGIRTVQRHLAVVAISNEGIACRDFSTKTIYWRDLGYLKLRFYGMKRRSSGDGASFMQLTLKGDKVSITMDSSLEGFRSHRLARQQGGA